MDQDRVAWLEEQLDLSRLIALVSHGKLYVTSQMRTRDQAEEPLPAR